MPSDAAYRKYTEQIVMERYNYVKAVSMELYVKPLEVLNPVAVWIMFLEVPSKGGNEENDQPRKSYNTYRRICHSVCAHSKNKYFCFSAILII